jgi:hypothetical protein
MSVPGERCDLSDRSLCDGPITRPEVSNRLCVCMLCVSLIVVTRKNNPVHILCVCRKRESRKVHFSSHIICLFFFFFVFVIKINLVTSPPY